MKLSLIKLALVSMVLMLPRPLTGEPLQLGIMDFPPFYTVQNRRIGSPQN